MTEEAKKLPTIAELKSKPTPELRDFLDHAADLSKASESTARKDFVCSDGTLVVASHKGAPISYVEEPPAAPPQALPGEA